MQNITHYVERKNTMAKLFGNTAARRGFPLPVLSLDSAADRASLADSIECDLSPENLTCDGELPRSVVHSRYKALTAAAFELKRLDPSVKFYEYGTEV